ncbi:hypothetical protein AB0E69_26495 [Kribbella sp. NPDC026611]|uniref:hypothetical protein n=1 Tax=Kribbella sp. NPDC026611 TaxID=3154911 RepID=UPI0033F8A9D2
MTSHPENFLIRVVREGQRPTIVGRAAPVVRPKQVEIPRGGTHRADIALAVTSCGPGRLAPGSYLVYIPLSPDSKPAGLAQYLQDLEPVGRLRLK